MDPDRHKIELYVLSIVGEQHIVHENAYISVAPTHEDAISNAHLMDMYVGSYTATRPIYGPTLCVLFSY